MAKSNSQKTYWPHMILGFLAIGITLGFWTVKHAIGMPVHESNEYMMKYQDADIDANKIREAQLRFDKLYNIKLEGLPLSDFKPEHLKRKPGPIVALTKNNEIRYRVTDKAGNPVEDANATLLLTRPFTEKDDQSFTLKHESGGYYRAKNVEINKPGRYILRVRVKKGDATGYQDTAAYLKP